LVALYTGGFALAGIVGYLDAGAALIDRALTLDPNPIIGVVVVVLFVVGYFGLH
jgi:hypothetical protein